MTTSQIHAPPHTPDHPTPRFDVYGAWPDGLRAMLHFNEALEGAGLEPRLFELVKLLASQRNGCAYCVDMHWKDAKAVGESDERLHGLVVWQETPFFDARERAALALTETLTRLGGGDHDAVFDEARRHFDEVELTKLVYAIALINAWNRLSIAGRPPVGQYRSRHAPDG